MLEVSSFIDIKEQSLCRLQAFTSKSRKHLSKWKYQRYVFAGITVFQTTHEEKEIWLKKLFSGNCKIRYKCVIGLVIFHKTKKKTRLH